MTGGKQHKMCVMRFHRNNNNASAPQCYVQCTLPILSYC